MEWNADFYEDKHGFVADYGKDLLSHVPDNPGQAILDLGCGTGALTQELLAKSAHVVGADASPDMVRKARMLHPDIDFRVVDACRMPWSNRFDVVFSNAVFHWISDQKALLENIFRVLKPQGRLVCEFGAVRNIHRIQQAFQSSLSRQKRHHENPFYFPTVEEYRKLVEQAGLHPELVMDYDRPTPLKDGENGLRNWVRQFFASDLSPLPGAGRIRILEEMESALRDELWDGTQWVSDYRRIRVIAVK